ncbi:hypothetical protein LOTGIDRAFT_239141 [Lottia gigantea]|uniref:Uncharacterized protein n=1 Tax=Lottia gigantea TaxID=225164 RepID=V4ASZ7_LOTGI|nr:hypothetical protein LOTGIDRAFT_239141 [Lottia gigantea]ESO98005.1 hypothetical protein LOTGIDRAFT_239141 [Lottia gigantea]
MVTPSPMFIPKVTNDTDIFNVSNIANYSSLNVSNTNIVVDDVHKPLSAPLQPGVTKEFPLALVVASPVVAVSILIFFCIAYYWHSSQLDKRAQMLAIQQAADAECGLGQRSPEPERNVIHLDEGLPGNGHPGGGTGSGRKHRGRPGRRISSPTNTGAKRGSTVTDKDILTHYAARRHSTFFI